MPEGSFSTPAAPNAGVLGDGWGIDHVAVVVRDLVATEELYRSKLGFIVSPGGRFPQFGDARNVIVGFGESYIEVVTVDPATAVGMGAGLAAFLRDHEGALLLGLAVSSAQQTADFLRARGLAIAGPEGGTLTLDSDRGDPPERWRYVAFAQPMGPADSMFFVEYHTTEGVAITVPPAIHPNTAQRLASVWMAVRDLAAATAAYESIGLTAGRSLHHTHLGASGRAVRAGRGEIWLLEAADEHGAVASFLARRGEGVIGMGIEVESLDRASLALASDLQDQLEQYDGISGRSILLNPEMTRGVWIELFQPATDSA